MYNRHESKVPVRAVVGAGPQMPLCLGEAAVADRHATEVRVRPGGVLVRVGGKRQVKALREPAQSGDAPPVTS